MAAENTNTTSSRSNTTADSYIGSLISLTSKSEIRYEGVLYNINTEESSIGLKNVRSFGTEGRKKDGQQIPPSDKVYEYILFRGTDIKDLQVKSSPPVVQHPTPINNDPAIIQSHYPRPVSTSASMPSVGSGSLNDIGTQQTGVPGSNFQGGLLLYQPGGNLGTWGASPPPPNANGSGLAMPMYWQGYYGPPNGLPHIHQQSLLRPPPGLSMPPSMQQPMQYPNFNTNLPGGASNLPTSNLPGSNLMASNLPVPNMPAPLSDVPSPLLSTTSSSLSLPSSSSAISSLPSTVPLMPSANLSSETLPGLMPNKAPIPSLPAANLSTSLPSISPLTTSSPELSPIVPPMANKPKVVPGPSIPYQSIVQPTTSAAGVSNSLRVEVSTPSLVTPGQLLQPAPTAVPPSQPVQTTQKDVVQTSHKDVEVVQVSASSSSEPSIPVAVEDQPPILPLPVPSQTNRPNGAPFHTRQGPHYYRGRGRGTGGSRPVTKFTEDFDFMAMNEKFNKDEVWGHLGKGNKPHKDKEDGKISDDDDSLDEVEDEVAKIGVKPVYNKDDFFDMLSSNANDHDSQNGRTRFSEQMKIDTETFGDFARYRGRGGRGGPRGRGGGRYRGSYHGRGYGYSYVGRGRGRSMPDRSF